MCLVEVVAESFFFIFETINGPENWYFISHDKEWFD